MSDEPLEPMIHVGAERRSIFEPPDWAAEQREWKRQEQAMLAERVRQQQERLERERQASD